MSVCAAVSLHFYSRICVSLIMFILFPVLSIVCVCVLHFAVVVELNMFSEAVSVCCYCFMFYISVTIT